MNLSLPNQRSLLATKKGDHLSRECVFILTELALAAGPFGSAFAFSNGIHLVAQPAADGKKTVVDLTGPEGKFRGFVIDSLGEVDVYLDNGLQVNLEQLIKQIPPPKISTPRARQSTAQALQGASLPSIPIEWGAEKLRIVEVKQK